AGFARRSVRPDGQRLVDELWPAISRTGRHAERRGSFGPHHVAGGRLADAGSAFGNGSIRRAAHTEPGRDPTPLAAPRGGGRLRALEQRFDALADEPGPAVQQPGPP